MKRYRLPALMTAAVLSIAVRAPAIELSLEENRAERGSVGYVDIQRLFKASPDASRAREGLEELVRQAEELVNSRKAAILRLRSDLGQLKVEREELAKSTVPVTAVPPTVAASTQAAASPTANLPGLTGTPAGPNMAQRLLEIDGLILGKNTELDRLQAELDRERQGAERSLLDAEGRKTDQVLARLYRAISEVAKREGVSVVIDKAATLYGHPAVDLTDKIIRHLQGASSTQ